MPQPTTFSDYPNSQADAVIPSSRIPASLSADLLEGSSPNTGNLGDTTATPLIGNTASTIPLPPVSLSPEEERAKQEEKQQLDDLFIFANVKARLLKMRTLWSYEVDQTIKRRLYRKVDLDPVRLRNEGKLKPDETIVPLRIIDTNIRRENPAYVNYLMSPPRQYVFECMDNTEVDSQTSQNLEKDVTRVLRYPGWEMPQFKCMDGAQLHGWDSVEVVFDESKPGKIGLEHIGHDNLFFGLDSIDLQANELLMRRYSVSLMQLRSWITKYGFDPRQVQMCIDLSKGLEKVDFNFYPFKVYIKFKDVVYIAWASLDFCDDWLKAPERLRLGIAKQVPVTKIVEKPNPKAGIINQIGATLGLSAPEPATIQVPQQVMEWQEQDIKDYPIFLNIYLINEEQPIMQSVGRGFLDKYKQEAMTAIATGYVNGLNRASNVYGSVAGDPSSTAEPVQLKTALNNGALYDREISFFQTPYPDPQCLTSLEFFATQNTEETGQVAIAAQNRLDSRKTAKEVEGAEQTQAQLSSVQVALYSIYLTRLGSFQWLILQSQALQGRIPLLQIPQPQLDPLTGQQTTVMVNNMQMLKLNYIVKPAGSVDVIQRQQMLSQMRQDWPVIQQTPLAIEFFKEFIRQAYPNQANSWIAVMDQNNQTKQLVQKLGQMLEYLAKQDQSKLSPSDIQTLKQVEQEVMQFLQPTQPSQMGQTQAGGNFGQTQLDSNTVPTQQAMSTRPSQ